VLLLLLLHGRWSAFLGRTGFDDGARQVIFLILIVKLGVDGLFVARSSACLFRQCLFLCAPEIDGKRESVQHVHDELKEKKEDEV
jgi:hypothetical protein